MQATRLLLAASIAATTALAGAYSSDAYAQDDYDDLDLDGGESKAKKARSKRNPRDLASGPVKEITRGTYAKANIGGAFYLLDFRGFVSPGTSVALAVGRDFVDKERLSMAGELMLFQGIHNGCNYEQQAAGECAGAPGAAPPLIQGDLRTYTIAGTWEISAYPSRRVGIGFRLGGGVMFSPLLMDEGYYQEDVVQDEWGGAAPNYHFSPHPVGMGGPTFEYYTKLSHFSVGADIDAFYAVGFDLGASATAYLKYTF